MEVNRALQYMESVIANLPSDWLQLTTHRLDIYDEEQAKTQFLDRFEDLYASDKSDTKALSELPTAYDYIRLGHPLSSILEWVIAKSNQVNPSKVISFSSSTIGILAILRKNLLEDVHTLIIYDQPLPDSFDVDVLQEVYGYRFDLKHIDEYSGLNKFDGKTILISRKEMSSLKGNSVQQKIENQYIDFHINLYDGLGCIVITNGDHNQSYISAIQHVRRRETIAMTPHNCLVTLQSLIGKPSGQKDVDEFHKANKTKVLQSIKDITGASANAIIGSSGLSIQYAILMGLVHDAIENHNRKAIKIIVPPNCYGGTNDQSRRVAAGNKNIEVLDLAVDDGHDMVQSIDTILDRLAEEDAVPLIIAEIPTNPRVEVPHLQKLREALSKKRFTPSGGEAIEPVFILDQTFCPNVLFLGEKDVLSSTKIISYVSGSKFPSGGLCTAGYCVANARAEAYLEKISQHLRICDNEATSLQIDILAKQMPSMNQRISEAYLNTRAFTNFINQILPDSKINFVSNELAEQGFTPSVFSLDLPTQGDTHEEREAYKRSLNHKLINMMITAIPNEAKHCVSYGQLKGSYWTIPATSTQGTTKESDKDYIVRVALSPDMDLERHKEVFSKFVAEI